MKSESEIIERIEELKSENEEMIDFSQKLPHSSQARKYYPIIVKNASIISGLKWVLNIKVRE